MPIRIECEWGVGDTPFVIYKIRGKRKDISDPHNSFKNYLKEYPNLKFAALSSRVKIIDAEWVQGRNGDGRYESGINFTADCENGRIYTLTPACCFRTLKEAKEGAKKKTINFKNDNEKPWERNKPHYHKW